MILLKEKKDRFNLDRAASDYLVLKSHIKRLETEVSELSNKILSEMLQKDIQKSEYDAGILYVSNHVSTVYNDEFNNRIKELKVEEEKAGRVEFSSKTILKSRLKD